MKESDLLALLREEIGNVRKSLSEDNVELSPGGNWSMDPPIGAEEAPVSAVAAMSAELINTIAHEGQEALELTVAMFEDAGMLDAMCATTQGTIGFRENLVSDIKSVLVEMMDDPDFGFGPDNEPRIDWPKRRLDVESEADAYDAMVNTVHRAKMSGISKEELAELFADAVHSLYEEST
jgi:hypothetical protein